MNSSHDKDSESKSSEAGEETPSPEGMEPDAESPEADTLEDPEVTPQAQDQTSEPKPRSAGVGVVAVLIAGLLGGVAGFFAAQFAPGEGPAAPTVSIEENLRPIEESVSELSDQLSQLGGQVAELEANQPDPSAAVSVEPVDLTPLEAAISDLQSRVAELDTSFAEVKLAADQGVALPDAALLNDLGESIDDVRKSISELEADLPRRLAALEVSAVPADLEARLQAFSTRSQYDALAARLSELESNSSGELAKQAAIALSLANLVRAIELGESFEAELETLTALAPARPELAALQPLAMEGLKRPAQLKTEFADLARLAIRKDNEVSDAAWWQQILMRLRALVSIRPVGDVEGATTEAIIARAEQRLEEGDLGSAVTELRGLSGSGSAVMEDWLADAEAHLQAEDLLQDLSAQILRELGQLKG